MAGAEPSADKVRESCSKGTEFDAIHEKFDHLACAMNTMAPVVKELKKAYDPALEEDETFTQDSHDSDRDEQSPRVTKKSKVAESAVDKTADKTADKTVADGLVDSLVQEMTEDEHGVTQ